MAEHIERRHRITLAGPVERIFPLFTPAGETLWVDGWNPEYLHPTSGGTCEGMVFRTGSADEATLWSCIAWQPEAHRVRYARVTPGSRFGFVEVHCEAVDDAHTAACVSYAFTALSPAGEAYLQALTEPAFVAMIEEWRRLIDAWLRSTSAEQIPPGR